jgi:hypothetical protein
MIHMENVSNASAIGFQMTDNIAIGAWAYANTTQTNLLFQDLCAAYTSDAQNSAFITINLANSVFNGINYLRCQALYPDTYGFIVNGVGNTQNTLTENINFTGCTAIGCGVNGRTTGSGDWTVGYDLCEGTNVKNMTVTSCVAANNYQNGFHFEEADSELNCKLVNCAATNNGQADGAPSGEGYGYGYMIWPASATKSISLSGCIASGNYRGDTNLGALTSIQG